MQQERERAAAALTQFKQDTAKRHEEALSKAQERHEEAVEAAKSLSAQHHQVQLAHLQSKHMAELVRNQRAHRVQSVPWWEGSCVLSVLLLASWPACLVVCEANVCTATVECCVGGNENEVCLGRGAGTA